MEMNLAHHLFSVFFVKNVYFGIRRGRISIVNQTNEEVDMSTTIRREVVGNHALSLFENRISLSKNGFIQSSVVATDYDAALSRLQEWYDVNGDDFLADGRFVDYVLFNRK